jgi:restriction-modification enzyme MmeI-like protein
MQFCSQSPSEKQTAAVEWKAKAVLDARGKYPDSSLADLYDPLAMPTPLAKAHAELDRAVETCYCSKSFSSDRERVEFLFALYEKLTALFSANARPRRRRGSA